MPYIICVNQPGCLPEADPVAVATIEEARQAVFSEAEDALGVGDLRAVELCRALSGDGGVIGPLPDGYVIDVQRIGWDELDALGENNHRFYPRDEQQRHAAILDAYNHA